MYLKRLVLIAGILFIVSSGELRAMEADGEDSGQEEAVRSQGSGSPRSTGSVASTASDSSARFRGIIAPLTAAVETLSAQIVSLLDARHHDNSAPAKRGSGYGFGSGCGYFDESEVGDGRGSSGAGASNAEPAVSQPGLYRSLGQSSLGSRWPVSPSAKTAAAGEGAFNAEELNLITQLAVLNSKLDHVVTLIAKTETKPIKFGGVADHPFGGLKVATHTSLTSRAYQFVPVGKPVDFGSVTDHPFGRIRPADDCNGVSGTISRVPSVSPISFCAVKSN